jgi:hypothetical protein
VSALILSVRIGVGVEKNWTLLGSYDQSARNSFFGMALSVFIAAETFGAHEHRYKILMSILILASAAYIAAKAIPARSIVGVATAAFSLIWILPIFNADIFYSLDIWFMLTHSILAIGVAVGAFTYMKN